MNIQKAIGILELNFLVPKKPRDPNFQEAIKLGIEALEQIKESRQSFPKVPIRLLPGETEY